MNITFKNGRIPTIAAVNIAKGQVYARLTLGEPYGSPSLGYTARVYDELGAEVGSALNQMSGTGWSVNVSGHTAIQELYQEYELQIKEEASIFDAMEAHFPQYSGWKRYRSPGFLQSVVDNTVTVNCQNGAIKAYWHKEDRWETL